MNHVLRDVLSVAMVLHAVAAPASDLEIHGRFVCEHTASAPHPIQINGLYLRGELGRTDLDGGFRVRVPYHWAGRYFALDLFDRGRESRYWQFLDLEALDVGPDGGWIFHWPETSIRDDCPGQPYDPVRNSLNDEDRQGIQHPRASLSERAVSVLARTGAVIAMIAGVVSIGDAGNPPNPPDLPSVGTLEIISRDDVRPWSGELTSAGQFTRSPIAGQTITSRRQAAMSAPWSAATMALNEDDAIVFTTATAVESAADDPGHMDLGLGGRAHVRGGIFASLYFFGALPSVRGREEWTFENGGVIQGRPDSDDIVTLLGVSRRVGLRWALGGSYRFSHQHVSIPRAAMVHPVPDPPDGSFEIRIDEDRQRRQTHDFDLSATFDLRPSVRLAAAVHNLRNQRFLDWQLQPVSPRQLTMGALWNRRLVDAGAEIYAHAEGVDVGLGFDRIIRSRSNLSLGWESRTNTLSIGIYHRHPGEWTRRAFGVFLSVSERDGLGVRSTIEASRW